MAGKVDRAERPRHKKAASQGHLVQVLPRRSFVGVHVFAHGLDHQGALGPVVAQLTQAIEAHTPTPPDDDFALGHHREQTLVRRFQALFFAPLVGIERRSAFDTPEHPLPTLLGRGYQSSTLRQFLGQLERVGAAEALRAARMPDQVGQGIQVDGHRIAYGSRRSMHKGKIPMRGRILAGSQAVIAHDATGHAVFVAYSPPDLPGSQVIVAYCQQGAEGTGRVVFVIDRAVKAVALAEAFNAHGLGLLCMLDANEQEGLESFEATEVATRADGTRVQSGPWQGARPKAPRHFVIVIPAEGKPLVYWGPPQGKEGVEAREWPRVYRERNAMQERSFKGMIDPGGLDINYGRKTLLGPDRHHLRKQDHLEASLETAHERVTKQAAAVTSPQAKVEEAEATGHGRRLAQRQGTLGTLAQARKDAKGKQAQLSEQAATWGPAGQRADRDFRKHTIMTIRTLLLENTLRAFMVALVATRQRPVRLEQILSLLFARSGARMEAPAQIVDWINAAGVSLANRRLGNEIVAGLCAMDLQNQSKLIHVRLKDMPP